LWPLHATDAKAAVDAQRLLFTHAWPGGGSVCAWLARGQSVPPNGTLVWISSEAHRS
jgi:hypothetical protein